MPSNKIAINDSVCYELGDSEMPELEKVLNKAHGGYSESTSTTNDTPIDAKDPWAHRSIDMRCRTCMWFVEKLQSENGRCRRHAPTMNGYPVVFDSDWCGDHKMA